MLSYIRARLGRLRGIKPRAAPRPFCCDRSRAVRHSCKAAVSLLAYSRDSKRAAIDRGAHLGVEQAPFRLCRAPRDGRAARTDTRAMTRSTRAITFPSGSGKPVCSCHSRRDRRELVSRVRQSALVEIKTAASRRSGAWTTFERAIGITTGSNSGKTRRKTRFAVVRRPGTPMRFPDRSASAVA